MKQKKKKIQNGRLKENEFFQLPQKAEQLLPKFHRLVLGLLGLIDAKGINFTQPIFSYGITRLT